MKLNLLNKKAAFEMSVQVIVILVIALVVLGLVIGFVVNKFGSVSSKLYFNEPVPEPSSDIPIQTPGGREAFSIGKSTDVQMSLKVYNSESLDYDSLVTNATTLECISASGVTLYFSQNIAPTIIGPGQVGELPALFSVSKTAPPGTYACHLILKTFPIWTGRDPVTKQPIGTQGREFAQRYMEITI